MVKYRKMDELWDMQGVRSGPSHLTGAEAVAAAIRSRILSFQGEWWEDEDDGVPLEALVGRLDEEREQIADALIRLRILGTAGVIGITEYSSKNLGRKRSIFATVETEFGTASLEVSL